jgi:hypothetical protein
MIRGRSGLAGQRGQTLYILVITIMVMMMVVGLAVDGGLAYYYQSRLDTAAQAAEPTHYRSLIAAGFSNLPRSLINI